MYRRGIRPSEDGEEECYDAMRELDDRFFTPMTYPPGALQRRRDRRFQLPLVEYIFRFVLRTVRCPRLHMWLRVHTLRDIPPNVLTRDGAPYIEYLQDELETDRRREAFGIFWERTYDELTQQELELTRRALGV